MKIAVYAIVKNEEKFINRWYESAREADEVYLLDTGSSDETVLKADLLGIHVSSEVIDPWRFDVARNNALALIPDDVDLCVSLDLDEIIEPGWRKELEKVISNDWTLSSVNVIAPIVVSHNEDGSDGTVFNQTKIHSRYGWQWKFPIHEALYATNELLPVSYVADLKFHHWPDPTKSRRQYLDLLRQATWEYPNDERMTFYYARELLYNHQYGEAKEQFHRYIHLSAWPAQKAEAWRYIAKCESTIVKVPILEYAATLAPSQREPLVDLAEFYYQQESWLECSLAIERALTIAEKDLSYFCEERAWNGYLYDIGAIAHYKLGNWNQALVFGTVALQYSPNDDRLKANLAFYQSVLMSESSPDNGSPAIPDDKVPISL